jgi:hypothetical protein
LSALSGILFTASGRAFGFAVWRTDGLWYGERERAATTAVGPRSSEDRFAGMRSENRRRQFYVATNAPPLAIAAFNSVRSGSRPT